MCVQVWDPTFSWQQMVVPEEMATSARHQSSCSTAPANLSSKNCCTCLSSYSCTLKHFCIDVETRKVCPSKKHTCVAICNLTVSKTNSNFIVNSLLLYMHPWGQLAINNFFYWESGVLLIPACNTFEFQKCIQLAFRKMKRNCHWLKADNVTRTFSVWKHSCRKNQKVFQKCTKSLYISMYNLTEYSLSTTTNKVLFCYDFQP